MASKSKFTTFLWCVASFATGGVIAASIVFPLAINISSKNTSTITQSTQVSQAQINDMSGTIEFNSNSITDQILIDSFKLVDESKNTFSVVLSASKLTLDVINVDGATEIPKSGLVVSMIFIFNINGENHKVNISVPLNNEAILLDSNNKIEFNDLKISFDIKFIDGTPSAQPATVSYR